ncbi:hypothetical protein Poly30_41400 [Planctomycetes bacterium Poly30]|uniref:Prenyltransferase and squalene oxidase repeat protein n=1 Tax=Saltatorellus ferox TaxID=2528018 RepID=A0A518EWY6_9BACT|nr:hypothetical protein Poly30_41400 [Planctomycetes bacterium Poly30]
MQLFASVLVASLLLATTSSMAPVPDRPLIAGVQRTGSVTGSFTEPIVVGPKIQSGADDPELRPYPSEGDGERVESIRRALDWLASRQESRDGSMAVGDASADSRAPLAITAFTALAWMAGGSTLNRGPHQQNVTRAIEYLLASVQGDADPYPGFIEDQGDKLSRTHGHGLATLALAEAYTVSPGTPLGRKIGEALKAAVNRIEISQGAEGGWYYEAYRSIQHEGSVTVALLQALRAADDVGVHVNPDTIARAVDYMGKLQILELRQGEDSSKLGGFRYGLGDPKTSVALTAAGLATLQAAGVYSGPAFEEGYDYLWRQLLVRSENPIGNESPFPYYERFYLSQALWHLRDTKRYRAWAEPEMRELLGLQLANGSWQDVRYANGMAQRNLYGAVYATACNVLFLALPDDTLPVFHR